MATVFLVFSFLHFAVLPIDLTSDCKVTRGEINGVAGRQKNLELFPLPIILWRQVDMALMHFMCRGPESCSGAEMRGYLVDVSCIISSKG